MCNAKNFLFAIILFLQLVSCEEVVNPELISVAPILVIDGILSNSDIDKNKIILSKTAPFNSLERNQLVSEASIAVEVENEEYLFTESEVGIYELPVLQSIAEGVEVNLEVTSEGRRYSAVGLMPNKLVIDSVTIEKRVDDLSFDDGFYITAHFEETSISENYYMWEIYVNDRFVSEDEILLSDDENLNGKRVAFELPFSIALDNMLEGDTLTLYNYSLSKAAFNYYNGLLGLTVTGSPSQAIPDNPISNIRGGALGFFNVCQIDTVKAILN